MENSSYVDRGCIYGVLFLYVTRKKLNVNLYQLEIMPLQFPVLRTVALCLVASIVLLSCSHGGSSDGGNPVNNSYLASVRSIAQGQTAVDSFVYDDKKRV